MVLAWNVYNSCPAEDMIARHSTHEDRPQRNLCHRSCCVCVKQHISSLSDADRSWGWPVSAVGWISEARWVGVSPANDWCSRHTSLNSTLRLIQIQCSFYRTGVTSLIFFLVICLVLFVTIHCVWYFAGYWIWRWCMRLSPCFDGRCMQRKACVIVGIQFLEKTSLKVAMKTKIHWRFEFSVCVIAL